MEGYNDFHYAISLAQTLWDIDINDMDKAEEIGLVAYNFIGNHHTRLYRALLDVTDGLAELPCNVLCIESVVSPCNEDWETSSSTHEYGDLQSAFVEDYIEAHKKRKDPLYQSGRFVKYRMEGNKLRVDNRLSKIAILYHGEILDDDGLPYINNKEAIAIADYIAYVYKYKEAMKSYKDKFAVQMVADLKQQWLFHCDAARVPEHISQNDMDMILDAQTSWNRKKYHFSFKPTL